MPIRFVIPVVLVLLLAVAGTSYVALGQAREATRYKGLAEQWEQAFDALRERQGRIQEQVPRVQRESAQERREVQDAIKANPDWGSGTVPPGVVDGLCKFSTCTD